MNKLFSTKGSIAIALIIYTIITSILTSYDGGDFDIYLDAAEKFSSGSNIYAPPFVKGMGYSYSPFFAWLLIPFCNHVFFTELTFSLLSYILLYRIFLLGIKYFETSTLSAKQYNIWVALIVIVSIQFIRYNISMVQVTILLLWAIFESINLLSKGKNILAGVLLGLVIVIKIMPILVFPYLIYRGYFKATLSLIVTITLLLFIPSVYIGVEYNSFLLSQWWNIINPMRDEHLFETGIGTHSIVAFLPVYLIETTGELPYKRNILNLNHETVIFIVNISRLLFLALSLLYLRTMPFKKENNPLKTYWELSYFILLIPLLMPHQQKYAFILAIPMIGYLIYFFIATYKSEKTNGYYVALYTFAISMLIYSPLYGSDIIGKFLFRLTQHYRLLTILTVLIIPISLYCSPKRFLKMNKGFIVKL